MYFFVKLSALTNMLEIAIVLSQKQCKLVPSNASEVSSDSTRKDLGRILTPNLQAIRVLQSNSVFNFITSESQSKI